MAVAKISREIEEDGSIVVSDARCKFVFRRLRPGAIEIAITGTDTGQFGTATIDEVAVALMRERPLELFVDASEASMPKVSVSQAWTQFFATHRADLKRVSVLTSSKSVALTMSIVQHLSNTGNLMQIYSDAELYEARKVAAKSGRQA